MCDAQRIAVLSDSDRGIGRPLGPSRLLFELGAGPLSVIDLRRRLNLDSGYLSRMFRQLEADGLVIIERDPSDGRKRIVSLNEGGRKEWRRLETHSERSASELIAPLSDRQRVALSSALETAERLLRIATANFKHVDIASADAGSAIEQYFAELDRRFKGGFDSTLGGGDGDRHLVASPTGVFLLVRSDPLLLGCGGLQRLDRTTGEIKRMWVHPQWRGEGLGHRLLAEIESGARGLGYQHVALDTNASLTEAVALYERSGYRPTRRYNDKPYAQHWLRKAL